jgi:hypothetical protein
MLGLGRQHGSVLDVPCDGGRRLRELGWAIGAALVPTTYGVAFADQAGSQA